MVVHYIIFRTVGGLLRCLLYLFYQLVGVRPPWITQLRQRRMFRFLQVARAPLDQRGLEC